MITSQHHPAQRIAAFAVLSWLGAFVHNMVDLPGLTLLSPENSIPGLITCGLFIAWWQVSNKRLTSLALLGWAFFVQFLGGGVLSVIPFAFWPWNPPQTLLHYSMHIVYALAQLPLMVAVIRQMRLNNPNQNISGANA